MAHKLLNIKWVKETNQKRNWETPQAKINPEHATVYGVQQYNGRKDVKSGRDLCIIQTTLKHHTFHFSELRRAGRETQGETDTQRVQY